MNSTLNSVKSLELQLPDQIATELDPLVRAGFYQSAEEAVHHSLKDFLSQPVSTLAEEHQREDIAWTLREASK